MATEYEHSHFIVHHLLKADLPINIKEKVKAEVQDHHFSWNHIVSNTDDLYYPVVNKILQQCTQPQVLALAHVEGPDGRIALSTATPVCKHEMRVMLRLFNTLEVVNQRPAFSNPHSDTQIFYALRYDPPKTDNGQWSLIHEDNKKDGDYLDEWDDSSHVSGLSRMSSHSSHSLSSKCSQVTIDKKMKQIKKEKGQQVIAKLTSRSDVVERELKIRKDFNLSRHYVPAVISVHHTVQHAAYSEAMAEPGKIANYLSEITLLLHLTLHSTYCLHRLLYYHGGCRYYSRESHVRHEETWQIIFYKDLEAHWHFYFAHA